MDLGFNGILLASNSCVRVLDFSPIFCNVVTQGGLRSSATDLLLLVLLMLGFVDSRKKKLHLAGKSLRSARVYWTVI